MSNKSNQLTRICSVCGIQKPLSAFMQLGGMSGTSYSTICATCRSTQAGVKSTDTIDERGRTSPALRIDKNTRIQAEIDKEKQQKKQEEAARKTAEKREQLITDKEEQKDTLVKAEKHQRETYKQGFLAKTIIPPPTQKTADIKAQTALSEEQKQALTEQQRKEAELLERTQTMADALSPVIDHPIGSEIQRVGEAYNNFLRWLGPDAPRRITIERYIRRDKQVKMEKNISPEEIVDEYVEKKFRPGNK